MLIEIVIIAIVVVICFILYELATVSVSRGSTLRIESVFCFCFFVSICLSIYQSVCVSVHLCEIHLKFLKTYHHKDCSDILVKNGKNALINIGLVKVLPSPYSG